MDGHKQSDTNGKSQTVGYEMDRHRWVNITRWMKTDDCTQVDRHKWTDGYSQMNTTGWIDIYH